MDGAVVFWCSGAAGDQNPRITAQYGGIREKGKPVLKNLGKATYTILEYLSDEHVRDVSPYENTILVSHAMEYQGYVADDWEYEHDAFEVGNSKAAKGAAQREFVKEFTKLFQEQEEAQKK